MLKLRLLKITKHNVNVVLSLLERTFLDTYITQFWRELNKIIVPNNIIYAYIVTESRMRAVHF